MAGHPKRGRLIKELERRAELTGPGASALDYLCAYLERGGRFALLARELEVSMGEPISRPPLVSNTAHWLDGNAGERLRRSRSLSRSCDAPQCDRE
jgi:hypothetical protein